MLTEGLTSARGELQALMLEGLPSAAIDKKLDEVLAKAQARAAEIASKAGLNLPTGDTPVAADTATTDADRAKSEAKIAQLNATYLTERELLTQKYADEQLMLQEALGLKAITENQYSSSVLRAKSKHENAVYSLEAKKQCCTPQHDGWQSDQYGECVLVAVARRCSNCSRNLALAEAAVNLPSAVISFIQECWWLSIRHHSCCCHGCHWPQANHEYQEPVTWWRWWQHAVCRWWRGIYVGPQFQHYRRIIHRSA